MHQELSSLSTVRGRVGYAFDNILLYATGGLAVGQVDYVFELNWPDMAGASRVARAPSWPSDIRAVPASRSRSGSGR